MTPKRWGGEGQDQSAGPRAVANEEVLGEDT